ncbi:SdpI family protein [Flavobacterium sp.]|uniref:SdpI family protein n=1 Tax=Flavobacterium sp. TaxID=239 RepID=UPI00352950E0
MKTLRKELPFILIMLLPFIYLAYIWNNLPEKVPLHWNGAGEIDRWGSKTEMLIPIVLLIFVPYVIFAFLPKLDPKGKLNKMVNKLNQLRFLFSLFMSVLAIFIIYSTQQTASKPTFVFVLIGFLFAVLGNYFKTIQPNYFIGIRTPWTLENEEVWKKTHLLGGKLWFAGGLLMAISCLCIKNPLSLYIFFSITAVITLVPIVYSYIEFKKLNA